MPEGDTIHRAARALGRALRGREVSSYWAYQPRLMAPRRDGRTVTEVEARGKNLLIHFDDARALYSHMKMTGAWHIYRPDERWRKPRARARVILKTPAIWAVCFSAPIIEMLTLPEIERHATLSTLGPDLLGREFDEQEALRRLSRAAPRPLGEVVMDQRVIAGIGNVYKSELLFIRRLDPFSSVGAVADSERVALLRLARRLMQANLDTHRRTTRRGSGANLWVYDRGGQPCLVCGARVRIWRQGDQARSTYYCERCQSVADAPPDVGRRGPRAPG